jgi:hypothetical protein
VDLATGTNGVTGVYDIEAIEDRWYDLNAEYFKVRTTEGKRYILRYAELEDQWTLQSRQSLRRQFLDMNGNQPIWSESTELAQ